MKRKIELLAPARNLQCGIEALRHGADAVYIGGPAFGARRAAGNSVKDIQELCCFAHRFGAKVYVTLNTILFEEELREVEALTWRLYEAGVDALIVQDLAFLKMNLPPIALHASTQMDNRTIRKAQFLESMGLTQIVLARELSLENISAICNSVNVPIEVFVHGALCVSYSGRCYASQHCFKRSANRGDCAQFCRLPFDLIDADGKVLEHDRHLLSLRDLNRSSSLEALLEAGVSSFKIEGRLKDVSYVKNITAYYRQCLDEILERRADEFERSSYGSVRFDFTPNPSRSFNRGFTEYFLYERTSDLGSPSTPKAVGEYVGKVAAVEGRSLMVSAEGTARTEGFHAGDGLCFYDEDDRLSGFRVNNVEGKRLCLTEKSRAAIGQSLYRNYDAAFERTLARPTAERYLLVDVVLKETPQGYSLSLTDEAGRSITQHYIIEKQMAQKPQRERIVKELSKLGAEPFVAKKVLIESEGEPFIPASTLANWRRECVQQLSVQSFPSVMPGTPSSVGNTIIQSVAHPDHAVNVANSMACKVCQENGAAEVSPAYELKEAPTPRYLMRCKYCLLYQLGHCKRGRSSQTLNGKISSALKEPLSLRTSDGRTFPLLFDCRNCEMLVCSPES
ncbi:MAG: U32 family peptidase [Bacteroidaceae bacterium]|nr:U32 family peptidase [Bacteroidaceae bacterium]